MYTQQMMLWLDFCNNIVLRKWVQNQLCFYRPICYQQHQLETRPTTQAVRVIPRQLLRKSLGNNLDNRNIEQKTVWRWDQQIPSIKQRNTIEYTVKNLSAIVRHFSNKATKSLELNFAARWKSATNY